MLLHPASKLPNPILNQTDLSRRLEAKDNFIGSANSFKYGYRLCYGRKTCQRSVTVYFTAGDGLRSENNSVKESSNEKREMVPFDIDLAVLLAGFAFESYYTPKENSGIHETDGSECETLFLSQDFVREVYQGQMTVKLIEGAGFPGLDLWGKSDPYVVLRIGQCGARSKTIWVTTDPIWNESFTINVVDPMTQYLQVAAWDENILAPPRRLGNAGISLDKISDGDRHEIDLQLEGIGGGGHVMIEVVVWRDQRGCRLVVAFRGTEQTRWKDLMTDLLLIPTGFNPERVKDPGNGEVLVHGGFLAAYDSVKARLIAIIKSAIGLSSSNGSVPKWHLYVTGHSLGGALATLLTMDISASKLSRFQDLDITMYNFGSPRVGNKAFAEQYNKIVKDSWRVVNHRDIIPTVPRLMGYCHVAQPIYLTAAPLGVLNASVENYLSDEYAGDVIGETTPETIVGEFLNGEKQLLQRLLQTEIAMLRALRDGSAFMQHMEDFYYISLLEKVASKYGGSKLTNQLLPEESIVT